MSFWKSLKSPKVTDTVPQGPPTPSAKWKGPITSVGFPPVSEKPHLSPRVP